MLESCITGWPAIPMEKKKEEKEKNMMSDEEDGEEEWGVVTNLRPLSMRDD